MFNICRQVEGFSVFSKNTNVLFYWSGYPQNSVNNFQRYPENSANNVERYPQNSVNDSRR